MATKKLIQGLSAQVPIVEDDGRPTAQFCDVLQRLAVTGALTKTSSGAIDVGSGSITLAQIQNIATQMIIARKTAGTGSPEVCTISDILDFLGTTRGSIMYRGVSGWSLLTPGTSGNVLQTNGAGADPTWVAPSGGGGGNSLDPVSTVPALGTWVNQGTATVATNADTSITLTAGTTGGSADDVKAVVKSLTIPYSIVIGTSSSLARQNWQHAGIVIRDSVSGKLITFGHYKDATSFLWLGVNYNSPSSKSGNVYLPASSDITGPFYTKISNDGTTRKVSHGFDPYSQPITVYSNPAGTWLTENQIGIFANNPNGGSNVFLLPVTAFYWK